MEVNHTNSQTIAAGILDLRQLCKVNKGKCMLGVMILHGTLYNVCVLVLMLSFPIGLLYHKVLHIDYHWTILVPPFYPNPLHD